ncbi:hypothetical protein OPT61_g396 [Boeremia exigua]|uniref:Uncharacterized protein n=1 Tax=Boeremia exigua TaxID=749465 RepID=A0ACC2IU00_9PLEO|nr:hypothetical protein OPT61_g396 [Boeremia exigua]
MAVHKDHPGLSVEVIVNGEALREYDDKEHELEPKTIAKYIEVQPGTDFAIRSFVPKDFESDMDTSQHIQIDGQQIHRTLWRAKELHNRDSCLIDSSRTFINGVWGQQKLRFGDLQTSTGDGDVVLDAIRVQKLRSLGLVKVKLFSGTVAGTQNKPKRRDEILEIGPVPEDALKEEAMSVLLHLGERQFVEAPKRWLFRDRKLFAVLECRYRSRADLQAIGVIPRSPDLTPNMLQDATKVTAESAVKTEPNVHVSSPIRQYSNVKTTSTPRAADPSNNLHNHVEDLSEEEIIAMIAFHRGRDNGLAGQSKRSLLGLLRFYEDKDKRSTPIKREPASQGCNVIRIKREHGGDEPAPCTRKRAKPEIIVLDD